MVCRGAIIFFVALVLIRISGRRSFGMGTPLGNIIALLLGSILSRAATGVSPMMPIVVTCTVLVVLHRSMASVMVHNERISRLVEGSRILLYEKGAFIERNMVRALVCKDDIIQAVRQLLHTEVMDDVDTVHMERNGKISVVTKTAKSDTADR
ncbi:DUF421 domain-containing protein [Nemorincola caseinilytica]|uniref:DUF421 domain-containing protein n=2 Tax=Nemorincola caseinilytica TaxID=2054315 RepID=A0ABP8N4F4_9BACT